MSHTPLQILIVEDDLLFGVELQMMVEELGYKVLSLVDNSGDALDLIFGESPDLILMDVQIKGRLSGIELGQKISHLKIPILYITSFDDPVSHKAASTSQMIGYLVKPLSKYSIMSAVRMAMESISSPPKKELEKGGNEDNFLLNDFFFFKKRQVYQKVAISDLELIEADGDYINVYTDRGEKYVALISMNQIEKQLSAKIFFRVHRSYIVNLSKISTINFNENELLAGGKSLPISKSRIRDLSKLINRLA